MRLRVWKAGLWMSQATTRLPFRFGKTTMTWAPILLAQVEVEDEQGTRSSGFASDLLVPRWFDKNPSKSPRDNVGDLLEAARRAVEAVTSLGSSTLPVFDLWRQTYQACFEAPEARGMEPLVRGFGVALLERALIDAACRGAGVSFFQALKQNLFGFEAAALHTELAGWDLGQSLPERALAAVEVRHTVGLLDPLRTSDIPAEERLNDGLPQALDDIIRHYGLSCFKVKLSGSLENDRERLLAIAEVFEDTVRGNLRITVDANEQYDDLADLVRLFEELSRRPEGRRLLQAMLYVEQPLPRAVSFDPARVEPLRRLSAFAPVMIDEADSDIEAFKRAVSCGYRGVSIKNCKGVFRSFANRGLCEVYSREGRGGFFQSAEDLTNLPVIPLQQDLATVAAHGLTHVERNGHHYFRGLLHLPSEEAREALGAHPDLYEETEAGIVLKIRNGKIEINSLDTPGYGYNVAVRAESRTPAQGWEFPDR